VDREVLEVLHRAGEGDGVVIEADPAEGVRRRGSRDGSVSVGATIGVKAHVGVLSVRAGALAVRSEQVATCCYLIGVRHGERWHVPSSLVAGIARRNLGRGDRLSGCWGAAVVRLG
jgi:hypothetical protein